MIRENFSGLSAFLPTPVNSQGTVNVTALSTLIERIIKSGVDSITVLCSTGIYAYLERPERERAVAAAVEAISGQIPLIVGVSALRTDWAEDLARHAERTGADGLLLAPMSYIPLLKKEVSQYFRSVMNVTGLPICIYNNPGTTKFCFSNQLISELSGEDNIKAIKMPIPVHGNFS